MIEQADVISSQIQERDNLKRIADQKENQLATLANDIALKDGQILVNRIDIECFKIDTFKLHTHFNNTLKLFHWPVVQQVDIKTLESADNFNANNYSQAVGTYIKWRNEFLPKLRPEEQNELQALHAQLTYNILHAHAPNHHIHLALKQEIKTRSFHL